MGLLRDTTNTVHLWDCWGGYEFDLLPSDKSELPSIFRDEWMYRL